MTIATRNFFSVGFFIEIVLQTDPMTYLSERLFMRNLVGSPTCVSSNLGDVCVCYGLYSFFFS